MCKTWMQTRRATRCRYAIAIPWMAAGTDSVCRLQRQQTPMSQSTSYLEQFKGFASQCKVTSFSKISSTCTRCSWLCFSWTVSNNRNMQVFNSSRRSTPPGDNRIRKLSRLSKIILHSERKHEFRECILTKGVTKPWDNVEKLIPRIKTHNSSWPSIAGHLLKPSGRNAVFYFKRKLKGFILEAWLNIVKKKNAGKFCAATSLEIWSL